MVLVPELGALAIALLCLGLALIATLIVKSLISSMGGVPLIGRVIGGILSPVAHALSWAAGQAEQGVDSILGATLHTLAKVLEWSIDWVKAQAALGVTLASLVESLYHRTGGITGLVHFLERTWHGIEHGVRDLTRKFHGIEHRVTKIEHTVTTGIGHDLRIEVAGLKQEVTRLDNKVIPSIRSAANTAEADVSELAKYIADNFVTDAELATAATAAAILAAAGLSWLRCNSNPFMNNRNACGLWGDLANLLALVVIEAAALASIYELIKVAQKVTPTITGLASELLKV